MKAAWFFFFVLLTAAILSAYSFSPSAEHVAMHASESEWITFVHGSIGSLSDFCFQPPRPNRVACFHAQDTHCNQYSVENKHEQSTKSSLGEVGARTACTEKASLRSLPIRELGDELSGSIAVRHVHHFQDVLPSPHLRGLQDRELHAIAVAVFLWRRHRRCLSRHLRSGFVLCS